MFPLAISTDMGMPRGGIPIPKPQGDPRVKVQVMEPALVPGLLPYLDDDTIADIRAAGVEPEAGVLEALRTSEGAWLVTTDGRPNIVIGVQAGSLLSQEAYVWLLCARPAGLLFARYSRLLLSMLLQRYPMIWGTVDPRRPRAYRLVQWVGARISNEEVEVGGVPHRRFYLGAW